MKAPEDLINRACEHFLKLMISVKNPPGSKRVLQKLITHYSEPHRYYHTLEHVVSMLDDFKAVSRLARDADAIRFAIWYHDVIYDVENSPLRESNEERSASLALEDLVKLSISTERIVDVCRMIRLTSHQEMSEKLSFDEQLFLDLDLAVLGKDRDIFNAYQAGIRYEYRSVEDDIYIPARRKILSIFFEREPLYLTPFFRERYEDSAKQNLARILNRSWKTR